MSDNQTIYNIPGGMLVNSILDANKIEAAFRKLIELHSSFRTCFKFIDDKPVQIVLDNVDFNIEVNNSNEANLRDIIDSFPKGFDLETAPLLRVAVHFLDNKKTLILIDSHHIIVDGSSLNILIRDFCKLYNDVELEKSNLEYVDYAVWENDFINSDLITDSQNYWVNNFKNSEIPVINLPYDYTIGATPSYSGDRISMKISNTIFEDIEKIAKEYNCSSYMVFLAVFYVLLYKYTSQDNIIVGSPIANRFSSDLQDIIGMFVNNIALNGHIEAEKTFSAFLEDIKITVLDAMKNQAYPYDLLVKKLDLGANNLFDVMFTYQNTSKDKISLGNNEFEIIEANTHTSKFNLSLEVVPSSCTINLEFRTDLFKKETVSRMLNHYINLLNNVSDYMSTKIIGISMLSDDERNMILYDFNNTKMDYPSDKTIAELFEEQVKQHPNNIAVIFKDEKITYGELNDRANMLAKKLYCSGIKPGDVVGVCLNRSIELIISICSIFKLGAVYMPMCIEYPNDRLSYMLENSNAKLLITNSYINKHYNFDNIKKEIIDSINDINYILDEDIIVDLSSDNIAYIIYTSGSTGKPKGVQISNSNLINFVYSFMTYFNGITAEDIFLSSTNISFDVSIFEIFVPLLGGASLVLYDEEVITNISLYCDTIINNKITTLYIPPNILNEVYSILKDRPIKINKLLVGVEAIRKSTLNKFLKLIPNLKIINGYGPTETTICCTALNYSFDDSDDNFVSIGRPLFNNQIFILSKDKSIQPIGIVGEIYVSGAGVGHGYINDNNKTIESYVPNIYNSSSIYMYKTGDLAKWNYDGTINFIGRNDSQVKISGHRIELKEISHVINSYPNIDKCFSTTYNSGNLIGIVSYFTADKDVSIKNLNAFLKTKLSNYMIPNFIMQIDKFPLTANGKIDKEKLPKNFISLSTKYVAPRNEFETSISDIWKKLFLINKIGINDNFFDLGGDSLIAIKFQIEAMNIGLNITYSDIFSYPTIKQLSEKSNNTQFYNNTNETYDYSKINKLISKNKKENILSDKCNSSDIGNVLLIGATGFLGTHLLDYYLSTHDGIVYCIIREKNSMSPEDRLRKTLNFYFGDKYNNLFGKRIIVINGDITIPHFNLSSQDYEHLEKNISVVINSAAIVKHYGNYKLFKDTNVMGTTNIINFCEKSNKKLYHISTLSVSGSGMFDSENTDITYFHENEFYIGQNLNNIYVYTKFEAEKLIFERIASGKLSACVLRIGNLMNRFSDGKFQINVTENAFINRIKSILKLGVIQKKFLEHSIEFTPVDVCSESIIKIIESNPDFSVFHLFNSNFLRIDTLLYYLDCLNIKLDCVDDNDFSRTVSKFLSNNKLKNDIAGIITDLDNNKLLNLITNIIPNSDFTEAYLNKLGFYWPKIDIEYIKKYINYFNSINFFD